MTHGSIIRWARSAAVCGAGVLAAGRLVKIGGTLSTLDQQ